MAKTFDFNKRSAELIAQSVSDEDEIAIMKMKGAKANLFVLDDGAFWSELEEPFSEIEDEVEAELAAEGIS